jgi:ubiquinone/menaquinone biosynthesis C-methylase UbiE/glycosyltransferase involved in cell wall biosynthesis
MTQREKIGERIMSDSIISLGVFQASLNQYAFAASFVKDKVTLDIACGSGYGSSYLKRQGARLVIGGDISTEAIQAAKQFCQGGESIDFVLLDAMRLPFSDDSFEAIVSIETLEHLMEHDKFLEECKRVLKDGGVFICSTPNKQVSAYVAGKPVNPYHINEVSLAELENLLNRYFVKVQLWGQDYWLRGNFIQRKLVSMVRSTLFRIYTVRQMAYFVVGLISRQIQPVKVEEKIADREQYLDERHKPFPIRDSVKPAGLVAVAQCMKQRVNDLQFSVVIPTKDRLDDLTECIQSLLRQTKRPKEIIVVDGSIYQQIEERIRNMCRQEGIPFKYIKQTEGKFARAKNLGALAAEGDIVSFVDDDTVLDDKHIEELSKVYERDIHKLIGGVKGICTNIRRYNPAKETYCRLFMLGGHSKDKTNLLPSGSCYVPVTLSGVKRADGFIGPTMSYRKRIFDEFRFDEEFEHGDELSFSGLVAQKYELYITPHAKLVHKVSPVARDIKKSQPMNTYAQYYHFRRLIKPSFKNKLCFLWSCLGYFLSHGGMFFIKPTKQNYHYAIGTIKGTIMIFRSMIRGKDVP